MSDKPTRRQRGLNSLWCEVSALLWLVYFGAVALAALALPTLLIAKAAGVFDPQATLAAPAPAAGAAITSSGVLTVGVDVAPGSYQTFAGPSCYWALLRTTTGAGDDVAASGHGPGPIVVTITGGHAALATVGCGNWTTAAGALSSLRPTVTAVSDYQNAGQS